MIPLQCRLVQGVCSPGFLSCQGALLVLSIIFVSCRIIYFIMFVSCPLRWTLLPKMSKESCDQSALFIGNGDDDATVLVVGGVGGNGDEAELLTNRPHQGRGEQDSGGGDPWRWQQLSPMREGRANRPGILLLGRERVLVVGGGSHTAEVLQLPRDDNDRGVWTLLTQPLTQAFGIIFLVNFNNRIVAVGELYINLVTMSSKQHLSGRTCFHFRRE